MNTYKQKSDTLLDRAIRVMDWVAARDEPSRFTDILTAVDFSRATLAKILRILCAHQMLEKTGGGYHIGSHPLIYAGNSYRPENLIERYRPRMVRIADQYGVSAVLFGHIDDRSICLDKVTHQQAPAMLEVGKTVEDYLVHPWVVLSVLNDGEGAKDVIRSQIENDASRMAYVREELNDEQIDQIIESAREGVADDHGWIIPNSRRLAVQLESKAGVDLVPFLMVGFFPGSDVDVENLKRRMLEMRGSR